MSEFRHVNAEVLEGRYVLARQVSSALEAFGLPAHVRGPDQSPAGVEVAVDSGDYDTGGVYATWNFSTELRLRMAEAVENGDFSDPVFESAGPAAEAMMEAVSRLLDAAGFSVAPAEDDLRPFAIRVFSAP